MESSKTTERVGYERNPMIGFRGGNGILQDNGEGRLRIEFENGVISVGNGILQDNGEGKSCLFAALFFYRKLFVTIKE